MTTPIYKGQPPAAHSGWLGSWFGGVSTPAYKAAPVKPSPAPTPAAPATSAASTAPANTAPSGVAPTDAATAAPEDPCATDIPSFALVIPRGVIEP